MAKKRAVDSLLTSDPKFTHWKTRFKAATGAFEQGQFPEARTLAFRALMEAEGLDDKDFAIPACNLGIAIISMEQGNLKEADEYFEKGLNSLTHSSNHSNRELYASGLRFRAQWHERQGDLQSAEHCLRESIKVLNELGDESAVELAYSMSDLCYILLRSQRIDEAGAVIESAMDLLAATVGKDDPAYDWANMIYQVCHTHDDEEALIYTFELSAEKLQYKVGKRFPNLVRALNAYSSELRKRGLNEKLEDAKRKFSLLIG